MLLLLHINLIANNYSFDLALKHNKGISSYEVNQNNVKSKLTFPYSLISVETSFNYIYNTKYFFYFSLEKELDAKTLKSQDFDWYYNDLSVYSSSQNILESFSKFTFGYRYSLYELYIQKHYQSFYWLNTNQHDYIQEITSSIDGLTLKYLQDFYKIGFTGHLFWKKNNFILLLQPTLFYLYGESIDKHILRNLHAIQKNQGLGYSVNLKLNYNTTQKISYYLAYEYDYFHDDSSKMNYYSSNGYIFNTTDASMKYKNKILSVGIMYKF